eukprot:3147932-Rhodomonas_salina.1
MCLSCLTRARPVRYAIGLRACYAISGTDIAYAATCLRACYAMPGTDLALPCPVLTERAVRYQPMRLLCDTRY